MIFNSPADIDSINKVNDNLPFNFPNSYINFLKLHNGCEGFYGEQYIIMWGVERLITYNTDYEVNIYAPNIFLFGSNGGGEGFGFDIQKPNLPIIRIPFIGMSRDYAIKISDDFSAFWETVNSCLKNETD